MPRAVVRCFVCLLAALIVGCATAPELEVVAPNLFFPGQSARSAAIVIPEAVMNVRTVTKLPTPCITLDYLPAPYGELFERTIRDRFSRLFRQVSILRAPPGGRQYDVIFEATLSDVAARDGCPLSPESYALAKGRLVELDPGGREIWRSSITSGRADTDVIIELDIWTGETFSNAIAILIDDWMRELIQHLQLAVDPAPDAVARQAPGVLPGGWYSGSGRPDVGFVRVPYKANSTDADKHSCGDVCGEVQVGEPEGHFEDARTRPVGAASRLARTQHIVIHGGRRGRGDGPQTKV